MEDVDVREQTITRTVSWLAGMPNPDLNVLFPCEKQTKMPIGSAQNKGHTHKPNPKTSAFHYSDVDMRHHLTNGHCRKCRFPCHTVNMLTSDCEVGLLCDNVVVVDIDGLPPDLDPDGIVERQLSMAFLEHSGFLHDDWDDCLARYPNVKTRKGRHWYFVIDDWSKAPIQIYNCNKALTVTCEILRGKVARLRCDVDTSIVFSEDDDLFDALAMIPTPEFDVFRDYNEGEINLRVALPIDIKTRTSSECHSENYGMVHTRAIIIAPPSKDKVWVTAPWDQAKSEYDLMDEAEGVWDFLRLFKQPKERGHLVPQLSRKRTREEEPVEFSPLIQLLCDQLIQIGFQAPITGAFMKSEREMQFKNSSLNRNCPLCGRVHNSNHNSWVQWSNFSIRVGNFSEHCESKEFPMANELIEFFNPVLIQDQEAEQLSQQPNNDGGAEQPGAIMEEFIMADPQETPTNFSCVQHLKISQIQDKTLEINQKINRINQYAILYLKGDDMEAEPKRQFLRLLTELCLLLETYLIQIKTPKEWTWFVVKRYDTGELAYVEQLKNQAYFQNNWWTEYRQEFEFQIDQFWKDEDGHIQFQVATVLPAKGPAYPKKGRVAEFFAGGAWATLKILRNFSPHYTDYYCLPFDDPTRPDHFNTFVKPVTMFIAQRSTEVNMNWVQPYLDSAKVVLANNNEEEFQTFLNCIAWPIQGIMRDDLYGHLDMTRRLQKIKVCMFIIFCGMKGSGKTFFANEALMGAMKLENLYHSPADIPSFISTGGNGKYNDHYGGKAFLYFEEIGKDSKITHDDSVDKELKALIDGQFREVRGIYKEPKQVPNFPCLVGACETFKLSMNRKMLLYDVNSEFSQNMDFQAVVRFLYTHDEYAVNMIRYFAYVHQIPEGWKPVDLITKASSMRMRQDIPDFADFMAHIIREDEFEARWYWDNECHEVRDNDSRLFGFKWLHESSSPLSGSERKDFTVDHKLMCECYHQFLKYKYQDKDHAMPRKWIGEITNWGLEKINAKNKKGSRPMWLMPCLSHLRQFYRQMYAKEDY